MTKFFLGVGAGVAVLVSCAGIESDRLTPLGTLARHPEQFDRGERLSVRGFLIRPPRSATFICNRISRAMPPKASGPFCIEVDQPRIGALSGARHRRSTAWRVAPISLRCSVAGFRPLSVRPERLVLACDVARD
jgi:hypothetical protein